MEKIIYLRTWVGMLLTTNPWELHRKGLLPQYLVELYDEKTGGNILATAKRLHKRDAVEKWLFIILMMLAAIALIGGVASIFLNEYRTETAEAVAVCSAVIAFALVKPLRLIQKGSEPIHKTVYDFKKTMHKLMQHASRVTLGHYLESKKIPLRDLEGAVIKQALDDHQYELALNLRRAEIVRNESRPRPLLVEFERVFNAGEDVNACITRCRTLLKDASDTMKEFGLGWGYENLFARANAQIKSEDERTVVENPTWVI